MTDTSLNPLGAYDLGEKKKKKIQICKHVWYKQTLLVLCEGYKFRNGVWECKEELGFPLETGDRPHRGGDIKEASIWHVGEEVRGWAPPQEESQGDKCLCNLPWNGLL